MSGSGPSYTHGHAESVLRAHRKRTAANSAAYLVPHLRPNMRLLDLGSGAGTITVDLARLVAPGRVTAVEISEDVLQLTRREAERAGTPNIDFLVGTVSGPHSLDLETDSFDVAHAHQVLQHLNDPVAGLQELGRVVRPGGLIAVRDSDYAGWTWWPELPGLDTWRALYTAAARANGGEPNAGRRLLAWAHAARFSAVTVSATVWTYAEPETRGDLADTWAERITHSAVASQLLASGLATSDQLDDAAAAWNSWSAHPDGWLAMLHTELLIRSPVAFGPAPATRSSGAR